MHAFQIVSAYIQEQSHQRLSIHNLCKKNKAIAICYSQLPILNIRKGKRIARVLFITFAFHKDRTILCAHQHLKFQVFTRNWLNGFQPKTRIFRLKSYGQRTAKRQTKLNHKTLPATWILASLSHQLWTNLILPTAICIETAAIQTRGLLGGKSQVVHQDRIS